MSTQFVRGLDVAVLRVVRLLANLAWALPALRRTPSPAPARSPGSLLSPRGVLPLTPSASRSRPDLGVSVTSVLAGLLLNCSAQGAIIYDNGAAAKDSGRCAVTAGCGSVWTVFDDFALNSAQTITDIHWTVVLAGGIADFNGVRAWIYNADPVFGGGTLLATIPLQGGAPTLNAPLNAIFSSIFYRTAYYDVDLSALSINLAAGTYWLGMQVDTNWFPASIACTANCYSGNSTQWADDGATYKAIPGQNYAFTLEGTTSVPEPLTFPLVLTGLALIGFQHRRGLARPNLPQADQMAPFEASE